MGDRKNWGPLREHRIGCMLHYDASASDAGAVTWLTKDPRCKVSYNWLVLDDGKLVEVAPADARAWHAGICKPSGSPLAYQDANSAFYGIAIAATSGETATEAQETTVTRLVRSLFRKHTWDLAADQWRLVGHDAEAWPRGRKIDPTGPDPKHPVLSVARIRAWVAA